MYVLFVNKFCFLAFLVLFVIMLSLLLLAAVISVSLLFLMYSSPRIDTPTLSSMLASLLPTFFSSHIQSLYAISRT